MTDWDARELRASILQCDQQRVRLLLQRGVPMWPGRDGRTPLHLACIEGQDAIVKDLINHGADLDVKDKKGLSPIHLACQEGRSNCVNVLYEHGALINVIDYQGNTPLHYAIRYLHASTAKLLVDFKVDPNFQNDDGETPLHIACNLGSKKLVALLLMDSRTSQCLRNTSEETVYDIAARNKNPELMSLLAVKARVKADKHQTKMLNRSRRAKIRQKLREASQHTNAAEWQVLYEDGLEFKGERKNTDADNGHDPLPKANGNASPIASTCHCSGSRVPSESNKSTSGVTQQRLLDEIDACYDELSKEISGIKQATRSRLAALYRDLSALQGGDAVNDNPVETPIRQSTAAAQPLTPPSASSAETPTSKRQLMEAVGYKYRDAIKEFDRLDLDDSCTTPTTASSRSFSRSATTSNSQQSDAGRRQSDEKAPNWTTDEYYAADEEFHQVTTDLTEDDDEQHYSQPTLSVSGGGAGAGSPSAASGSTQQLLPETPSLDSGYGTGLSPPSPPVRYFGGSEGRQQALKTTSTQTDDDTEGAYMELECVRCSPLFVATPLPMLHIPPPPKNPPPPLPKRTTMSGGQRRCQKTLHYESAVVFNG